MYTLYADVQLTRRNRMHHVMDDAGVLKWSGKSLLGALEYLAEQGQDEFKLEGDDTDPSFLVMAKPD